MSTENETQKPPEHEPGLHERIAIGDKAAVLAFMGALATVASVLDSTHINYSSAAVKALSFNLNAASLGPENDLGVRLLMDTEGRCHVPFSPDKPWSNELLLDATMLTKNYIDNGSILPGHTLLKIIEEIVGTGEFTDEQRDTVTALLPDYDN